MHLKHIPAPEAMAAGGTKGCLHCHQNHHDTKTRKSRCFFMVGRRQRKNGSSSTSREQHVNPLWWQQLYPTQQCHHTADAFVSCPLPLFFTSPHSQFLLKEPGTCLLNSRLILPTRSLRLLWLADWVILLELEGKLLGEKKSFLVEEWKGKFSVEK